MTSKSNYWGLKKSLISSGFLAYRPISRGMLLKFISSLLKTLIVGKLYFPLVPFVNFQGGFSCQTWKGEHHERTSKIQLETIQCEVFSLLRYASDFKHPKTSIENIIPNKTLGKISSSSNHTPKFSGVHVYSTKKIALKTLVCFRISVLVEQTS